MSRKIFIIGYPGAMGGANTEAWHTAKLFKGAGWDVTFVPAWGQDPEQEKKLDGIGVRTLHVGSIDNLKLHDEIAGAIVLGFCSPGLVESLPLLQSMACKTVWVNCMTFVMDPERKMFSRHRPDAFVYQSDFQRTELEPKLAKFGADVLERGHRIRGFLDVSEFPFAPLAHADNTPFVVGKLARPAPSKWSSNLWKILKGVPYTWKSACVMGWDESLRRKCGAPPSWASAIPPRTISAQEFLARCHVLVGLNGGDKENWPRVGLEAMAAGVPLVVENAWGWLEMVEHGETGFLCNTNDQADDWRYYLADLARDERKRIGMAFSARERVEKLCRPETIADDWERLFLSLETEEGITTKDAKGHEEKITTEDTESTEKF